MVGIPVVVMRRRRRRRRWRCSIGEGGATVFQACQKRFD